MTMCGLLFWKKKKLLYLYLNLKKKKKKKRIPFVCLVGLQYLVFIDVCVHEKFSHAVYLIDLNLIRNW